MPVTGAPSPSARAELARLALSTAVRHPDVTGSSGGRGGVDVTTYGDERLEGVSAAAEPGGESYALRLRLSAKVVPLEPLSEELRERIHAAAADSTDAASPGAVDIEFVDIETPSGR